MSVDVIWMRRNPVAQMRRPRLAVAVLVLALVMATTALAGGGYRIKVGDASTKPAPGAPVSVMGLGAAPKKTLMYLYLDRKTCRSTWVAEAKRFTTFKAGQSYFKNTRKAWVKYYVTGQFDKAFSVIIGTRTGLENVCAYLAAKNSHGKYTVTVATGSAKYTVTG